MLTCSAPPKCEAVSLELDTVALVSLLSLDHITSLHPLRAMGLVGLEMVRFTVT